MWAKSNISKKPNRTAVALSMLVTCSAYGSVMEGHSSVSDEDLAAPETTILYPATEARVPGNTVVNIKASASDDVEVKKVEFYINGRLRCTKTAAPYICDWPVPNQAGRVYIIQSKAYDGTGKVGESDGEVVTVK
jgi:chitinase